MSGSFVSSWQYVAADVWEPLAAYVEPEGAAPEELFGDLFAAADEFLSPRPSPREFEEVRNIPGHARQRFLALTGTDFTSEAHIVAFVEEAYAVIRDYENEAMLQYYVRLVDNFLRKYNLRYKLEAPFELRFLLPGSFANLYAELHRINSTNTHLLGLWRDFELGFDVYARTRSDSDLRTSIARASNYVEGLASATHGQADTLGRLSDQLKDWPHATVKEALKSLYGFCSNYPGIRHAGNPSSSLRTLDARDSVAINVALMALAAYLSTNIDHVTVLGSGGSSGRPRTVTATTLAPSTPLPWWTRFWRMLWPR